MSEFHSILMKYNFGDRFRRVLHGATAVFLSLYMSAILLPFSGFLDEGKLGYVQGLTDAIGNIVTVTLVMVFVVEGQRSIRKAWLRKMQDEYRDVRGQIVKWLSATGSEYFHEDAVAGDPDWHEALWNFQVRGHAPKLAPHYSGNASSVVERYAREVHFELTMYPSEAIYGIHFEMDDYALNMKLYEKLSGLLALDRQSSALAVNTEISKKPAWIFLTRTYGYSGSQEEAHPFLMTFLRHFVELACHSYDTLYGREMISYYLELLKEKR